MSLIDKFYNKIVTNLISNKKNFYLSKSNKVSYYELFRHVKKINFYLQNLKNEKVGLYCDKSEFYYAAVIAILLSGNTWIQIPKNNPKERNKYIVNESNIHLIIVLNQHNHLNNNQHHQCVTFVIIIILMYQFN